MSDSSTWEKYGENWVVCPDCHFLFPKEDVRHRCMGVVPITRFRELEAQLVKALRDVTRLETERNSWQEGYDLLAATKHSALQQIQSQAELIGKLRDLAGKLTHQIRISGAVDDHGHDLRNLKALHDMEAGLALPVPSPASAAKPHQDILFLAWLRKVAPKTMEVWERNFRVEPDILEECEEGVDPLKPKHPDTVRLDKLFATRSWRLPLIPAATREELDALLEKGNPDTWPHLPCAPENACAACRAQLYRAKEGK
jgi:hypothetical protein